MGSHQGQWGQTRRSIESDPIDVKNGVVELKHRATGERQELGVEAALARLAG
jgi:predicted transcriptional regulator with HTH domain